VYSIWARTPRERGGRITLGPIQGSLLEEAIPSLEEARNLLQWAAEAFPDGTRLRISRDTDQRTVESFLVKDGLASRGSTPRKDPEERVTECRDWKEALARQYRERLAIKKRGLKVWREGDPEEIEREFSSLGDAIKFLESPEEI